EHEQPAEGPDQGGDKPGVLVQETQHLAPQDAEEAAEHRSQAHAAASVTRRKASFKPSAPSAAAISAARPCRCTLPRCRMMTKSSGPTSSIRCVAHSTAMPRSR